MNINVCLYGLLARRRGKHYIQMDMDMQEGSRLRDLLTRLDVADEERGYLFVNAVLYEVPGLTASSDEPLHDGDHVGIFALEHVWPYQYRDGARMSDPLKQVLQQRGSMHHTYATDS